MQNQVKAAFVLFLSSILVMMTMPLPAALGGFGVASGRKTAGASTGNVSVTGTGFTPKAVLMFNSGQTTENTSGQVISFNIGAAVSSSNRVSLYHRRNSSSTTSFSRHTSAAITTSLDTGGTINLAADFVSMDSDGFTFNVGTSPSADFFFHWIAWGGPDVKANIIQFDSRTSTGSTGHTGMGFKPDVLIIMSNGMTASIPTTDGNARPGIGFVDSALNQAGFGNKQVSGANTSRRSQSTSNAIYIPDTSAMWLVGSVTSMDSDGFTMNYTTVQGSAVHLWALGLAGVRSTVGSFNQATSTGDQSSTAVEYKAQSILMGSFCAASATGQQNNGVLSFGAATAGAQGNNSISSTSGGNNTGQGNYNNETINCILAGTPTIDSQASFSTFDARGWTINNGTADATARQIVYLTISPLPLGRMLLTKRFPF